ncbi:MULTISPECIES: hypothetical protein [Aestuariibaculum]|uniref:Uncharacterized protein n=1 Tax=Aestuariibaculum lutulentum TaxID=2920935 RepID=A0ABS9RL38_9FLAO|nr:MULTISPECIES: hypothetical protein [Aestuariibaculum]MCH4553612.1 hypothetical protein [Aestuariibaculum lutulentum]MCR8668304.1 hypothetical protein [Aestuariibaculum sp. M13]
MKTQLHLQKKGFVNFIQNAIDLYVHYVVIRETYKKHVLKKEVKNVSKHAVN